MQVTQSRMSTARVESAEYILLDIPVRCILIGGFEFSATLSVMSIRELHIKASIFPAMEEQCIVCAEKIGRIEGQVTEILPGGFVIKTLAGIAQGKSLRDMLEALRGRGIESLSIVRRDRRIAIAHPKDELQISDGTASFPCEVINLSLGGVSLRTPARFEVGTQVDVGKTQGVVARHHEQGLVTSFLDSTEMAKFADRFGWRSIGQLMQDS